MTALLFMKGHIFLLLREMCLNVFHCIPVVCLKKKKVETGILLFFHFSESENPFLLSAGKDGGEGYC